MQKNRKRKSIKEKGGKSKKKHKKQKAEIQKKVENLEQKPKNKQ